MVGIKKGAFYGQEDAKRLAYNEFFADRIIRLLTVGFRQMLEVGGEHAKSRGEDRLKRSRLLRFDINQIHILTPRGNEIAWRVGYDTHSKNEVGPVPLESLRANRNPSAWHHCPCASENPG